MPEINHRKQETPELKLYTTSRQLWTCQITPLNKIKFIAFAQVGESKAVFACIYGPGGGGGPPRENGYPGISIVRRGKPPPRPQ